MDLGSELDEFSGDPPPLSSLNQNSSSHHLLACLESPIPDPRWPSKHRWSESGLAGVNQVAASSAPVHASSQARPAKILSSVEASTPAVPLKSSSPPSSTPMNPLGVSSGLPTLNAEPVVSSVVLPLDVITVDSGVPPLAKDALGSVVPPLNVASSVKSLTSDKFVSPNLKGAWSKPLNFSSSSTFAKIHVPGHSHQDSTKEDNMRFPWAAKMDPAARNLYRATSPEYMEDGTPKVTIPSHVMLQGLENQKEYVLGQFYRCSPPSGGLVHAVVNRIWGRKCRIYMRKLDDSKFLFHIPDASTRNWVLQRGLWHVDDCIMFVAPWSTADTFDLPEISTIPVWVTLKNIPSRLYSIPGISHIASGLGAPMAAYKPRLDPSLMGEAKILVEVELSKAFPSRIAAADKKGNISMVDVEYAWIPAKCAGCGQLGHKASRCMQPQLPNASLTKLASNEVVTHANQNLATATVLVSPNTNEQEPPSVAITAKSVTQEGTALDSETGSIQVTTGQCSREADCLQNDDGEDVTEAICSVEKVLETVGTKNNEILSDCELGNVLAKNRFSRLGSSFSDGDSLPSDGESVDSDRSDSESGLMDHMTPFGQRLLRERPVPLSIKAKEVQESSNARGRGNRGRGNRGRGNRGRGYRGRG